MEMQSNTLTSIEPDMRQPERNRLKKKAMKPNRSDEKRKQQIGRKWEVKMKSLDDANMILSSFFLVIVYKLYRDISLVKKYLTFHSIWGILAYY